MGTGPILLLDKSTFQMLSSREHLYRSIHFFEALTPIPVTEILGDLSKVIQSGQDPAVKVAELAGKFHGSGGVVNLDARLLVVQALIGNDIPMTGQVLPQGVRGADDPELGRGFMVDLTWWNDAIMRWRAGRFSDVEKQHSELWRSVTHLPGFSSLWDEFKAHGIILPKIRGIDELATALDNVVNEPHLQNAWLEILLHRFRIDGREEGYIRRRWAGVGRPMRTFAPYACHCLKVWVGLAFIVRHNLFKWQPTHLVDIQYLNYLPFCQVFSSNDKLHRLLAPVLKRDDQTFLNGDEIKGMLKAEADIWDAMDEQRHSRLRWALNCPFPKSDSTLFHLWRRYLRVFVGSNRVCHLSDDQRQIALGEANALMNEAMGEQPAQA